MGQGGRPWVSVWVGAGLVTLIITHFSKVPFVEKTLLFNAPQILFKNH